MRDHRFYVYVIESPSPQDLLNGSLEGRVLSESLNVSRIDSSYQLAVDEQTFEQAIGSNLNSIFWQDNYKRTPILHISAHGNQEGIALTNGAFIPWENFRNRLSEINSHFNGNLLVSLSACHGAYASRLSGAFGLTPYFALVGPTDITDLSDLAIGYSSFYHVIRKTWDLNQALNALKVSSCNNSFDMVYGTQFDHNYHKAMNSYFGNQLKF
ncbi:hypothetical protein CSB62_16885 [Vibrio splendidus]|uniref:CHAT domain-containing protein n=1 Tax=Vibrio lentus TaxID=136468 RepID=A0A4U2F548_9VIBR|nr:hypothetical protein [Vibrio lentus]PHN84884.1 hypothetical protein CSB62_16885 [Vibrio splendidus]PME64226.1 hypothetical protein BCV33_17205 [Vibrio lentus]PMG63547.1 hypothetical protein BCU87_10470 [Vibrio lentus]PMM97918.1 hypothetical protein BCT40_11615 [Vibrio lentus]TKF44520.1 hypothetical protein FCV64_13320 [Vibrio lentus]